MFCTSEVCSQSAQRVLALEVPQAHGQPGAEIKCTSSAPFNSELNSRLSFHTTTLIFNQNFGVVGDSKALDGGGGLLNLNAGKTLENNVLSASQTQSSKEANLARMFPTPDLDHAIPSSPFQRREHVLPLLLLISLQVVDVMLFDRLLLTLTTQSLQVHQPALHLLKVTLKMGCKHNIYSV